MRSLALAIELATGELDASGKHLEMLKERLAAGIRKRIEQVHRNGSPTECLPNILNMSFAGVDGEALLLNLDLMGVAVSTGYARSSGATEPSHVLLAMGVDPLLAQASLRFSFGRDNTEERSCNCQRYHRHQFGEIALFSLHRPLTGKG